MDLPFVVVPMILSVTMLFGVEASHLTAWSALVSAGPYAEFIERWSSAEFAAYWRRWPT